MGNVLKVQLNVDTVVTRLWDSAAKVVAFKCQIKDNFVALNLAATELRELQNDVKRRVGNEEGPLTKRLEQVQGWLLRVDLKMAQVEELIRDDGPQEMGKLCLGGCCSRNCVSSYRFGKRVGKRLKDVNDLKGQGHFEKVVERVELEPVYVSQLEHDLHSLEVAKEHLSGLKDDLMRRLQVEEGPVTRRLQQVQVWLSRVESVLVEVNGLIEGGSGEIEKLRLGDFSRYRFAEKVATKLKEVIDLTGQGVFEKVVDRAPAEPAYVSDLEITLEALQAEKADLRGLKDDLMRRITNEEGPQMKRLEQVGVWLSRVDGVLNLVGVLLDDGPSEIEKMRLGDFSNYMLGEKVTKTLKEVIDLKDQGAKFEKVVDKAPAEPAYISQLEDDLEALQTAAGQLKELRDDIMQRINNEGPQMKPLEQVQAWLSNVDALVVDIGFLRKDGLKEIGKMQRGEFSSYMLEEKVAKIMEKLIRLKLQGSFKEVAARAPPEPAHLIQLETDIKSLQAACCELQDLRVDVMQRLKIEERRQVKLLQVNQLQISQVEAILAEVNGLIRDCLEELKKLRAGDFSGCMHGEKVAQTLKDVDYLKRLGVAKEFLTAPTSKEYINHVDSELVALQEANEESLVFDMDGLVPDGLSKIERLNLIDHSDAMLKESRAEELEDLVAEEHEKELVVKAPKVPVVHKPQELAMGLDAAWSESDEKQTAVDGLGYHSNFPSQEVNNKGHNDRAVAGATTAFSSTTSKEATQKWTAPYMFLKSKTDSHSKNGKVTVPENYLNSSLNGNDVYERLHEKLYPISVEFDNSKLQNATLITVNSDRRRDVLLEAVQVFTDLNLSIVKADLLSDVNWITYHFQVTDEDGNKIHDDKVTSHINNALVAAGSNCVPSEGIPLVNHTVLEITGSNRPGIFSEFSAVLEGRRCKIINVEFWTDNRQIAMVMQINDEETGSAIVEPDRLAAIKELLLSVLKSGQDSKEPRVAFSNRVTRAERRLHQMMLASIHDEDDDLPVPPDNDSPVNVSQGTHTELTIKTKDWPKLLYDIVCILTDLKYTIIHATVSVTELKAFHEYFIRHANGSILSSDAEKRRLIRCVQSAIDRRAREVQELKLGISCGDRSGLLSELTRVFREDGITITRAELQTRDGCARGTFYVRGVSGQPVDSSTIDTVRERVGLGNLVVKCTTPKELKLKMLADQDKEIPASSVVGGFIKSIGMFNFGLGITKGLYNS